MSEEEWRIIEIRVLDIDKDVVFEVTGNVSRETAQHFIEGVGYAFVPRDTTPIAFPRVSATAIGKISCEQTRDCTDYPKKCPECAENRAKSYFKPKKVSESEKLYPLVIIGTDRERAGDVNYFYYEPGTDASIVFEAAMDYMKGITDEV